MTWDVRIVPEADDDLPKLRKANPALFDEAEEFVGSLVQDPYQGVPCERLPLSTDSRKFYFGHKGDHRIVWRIIPDPAPTEDYHGRVDVLMVGYKGKDSRFFAETEERWRASELRRMMQGNG